jgi:hypothetical protein
MIESQLFKDFFYYQNRALRRGRQVRRGDVGSQADGGSSDGESRQEKKAVSEPYEREHGGTGCGQQSNHAPGNQTIQVIRECRERPIVDQARTQRYALPQGAQAALPHAYHRQRRKPPRPGAGAYRGHTNTEYHAKRRELPRAKNAGHGQPLSCSLPSRRGMPRTSRQRERLSRPMFCPAPSPSPVNTPLWQKRLPT